VFSIQKNFFGNSEEIIVCNNVTGTCLKCLPEHGANIRELYLQKNGMSFQILDGFQTEAQLLGNEKSRGIFLIPFPNRIRDGKYSCEEREYQLPVNKPREHNAIHGFIWKQPFKLLETLLSESSALLQLKNEYHGDYIGFPFPFTTELRLELHLAQLKISITVTNTGTTAMPLGIGWHPYFSFNKKADELSLQIPACNILETDKRMIPTGNRNVFEKFHRLQKIETTSFDTCFEFIESDKMFETKIFNSETNITISLWQENIFRYIQVYIPPDRNSIALEPMTCPADAFNSKENLLTLKPNEKFEGNFGVKVT
jgi:aldose 1-epimerase